MEKNGSEDWNEKQTKVVIQYEGKKGKNRTIIKENPWVFNWGRMRENVVIFAQWRKVRDGNLRL